MKKYILVLLSFVFIVSLVFIASCQKTVTGETDKSMESNANKPVVEKTTTTKPELNDHRLKGRWVSEVKTESHS